VENTHSSQLTPRVDLTIRQQHFSPSAEHARFGRELTLAISHPCASSTPQYLESSPESAFALCIGSSERAYLVDDISHPLRPPLRRKGEACGPRSPHNVGDVVVKAVDPLAWQGQRDCIVLEPVLDLNAQKWTLHPVTRFPTSLAGERGGENVCRNLKRYSLYSDHQTLERPGQSTIRKS
jgi:hypothetical protein